MCFSATASFATTGAVTIAGTAALRHASRPQLLLAAIPVFFAIHQFAEGVLWLALSRPQYAEWEGPAILTYMIVSKVVWPFWVPLAMLALETFPGRRRLLAVPVALGAVLSLTLAWGLDAYPVTANIAGPHMQYRQDSPAWFRWPTDISYVVVTVLPPLVSSIRPLQVTGLLLLTALVVSKAFFYLYSFSIWCFFAALISILVVAVVKLGHRRHVLAPAAAGLR